MSRRVADANPIVEKSISVGYAATDATLNVLSVF